jgi:ABC-type glycerol-3-phosphate transport system substrate-binding protein
VSTVYGDFPERAIKNLVQPLDEYLVMGDTLNKSTMEKVTSYNGKHYALMRSAYPCVIYYNADMFEEYGEKTPLEYYNAGNWNWNTFRTVAANMTDVQNGKVKTYGFGIDNEAIFMLSAGTDAIKFENGTPKLNVDDPKFTSSLDFFYKMCNTDKSVYAERWLNFNAFLEEKTAMSYWRADANSVNRLKEAKIKWEVVPFPKAEGAKEYYGDALGDGWSLGVNCTNPLGGIAFAEWEINDRAKLNEKIGFSAAQKKRLSGIVSTVSFIGCYGLETSFNNSFCNAMRNNGSMSAKLEEYIPEWNMLIDDVVNGR